MARFQLSTTIEFRNGIIFLIFERDLPFIYYQPLILIQEHKMIMIRIFEVIINQLHFLKYILLNMYNNNTTLDMIN